jgi:pimeloyl-ACP methyl ester carboxylesterase
VPDAADAGCNVGYRCKARSRHGVIKRLQPKGVRVTAPANPLRGIAIDSAYIAGVLDETPGPVLAVGHSYGGAVITNAAKQAKNVVGLVYVAAFAPEEGEHLGEAEAGSKDSVLMSALVPRHYPANGEPATEFAIDPERFRDAFAADLPAEETALMAATNGLSPRLRSPSRRDRLPGRSCPPGLSSRPAIRLPAPTSFVRWRSGPARRSPRSRGHTRS